MSEDTIYRIKSRAFEHMTGLKSPGETRCTVPTGSSDFNTRCEAWRKWHTENSKCIKAMIEAFENVFE